MWSSVVLCVMVTWLIDVTVGVSTPLNIYNSWDGGFEGKFIIHADREVTSWEAHLHFNSHIDQIEIWRAKVVSSNGYDIVVQSFDIFSQIPAATNLEVTFVCRSPGTSWSQGSFIILFNYATPKPTVTTHTTRRHTAVTHTTHRQSVVIHTTKGDTDVPDATPKPTVTTHTTRRHTAVTHTTHRQSVVIHTTKGDTDVPVSAMKYPYDQAMAKSILFYDAQRSGRLPANNPIPWRGDSAVNDGDSGHDLSGGWYDAGDHVKFNLPMSFSTWMLNWGFLKYRDAYEAAGQTQAMCDMIRWPLEYFLKCWIPSSNVLYVQVGNADTDHKYWGRPENMDMWRPAYKVDQEHPGSDVAADTAAAMASGYLVFKDICKDASFAHRLLNASKSLYTFANNTNGKYSDHVPANPFYTSTGFQDEKSVAGAWMYLATNESGYLGDTKANHDSGVPWAFFWDDVRAASNMLLYDITKEQGYKSEVEGFVRTFMPGGSVPYTPGGLAFRDRWAANRYSANVAFIALMAAEAGIQPDTYKTWAMSQINYMLGDNRDNRSYEIGFGQNFPHRPHHRGSSCRTTQTWCDGGTGDPNPNELTGALVGGPGHDDGYSDDRSNYENNEVACDYNAGFQGALAGLYHFALKNSLPAAPVPRY